MNRAPWFGFALALVACAPSGSPAGASHEGTAQPSDDTPAPSACTASALAPAPEPLHWKRVAALGADVHRALELPAETGCRELDRFVCTDVHRVPLGGNDIEGAGQLEPVAQPLSTTSLTIDRLVLGACVNRVDLDAQGPAAVFTELDFARARLSGSDARVHATSRALFRRLLRREGTDAELAILDELADGASPRDFAVAACLAVGTTSENVLF